MIRNLLSVLLLSLPLICVSPALAQDGFVYRQVKWGMTVDEVLKSECCSDNSKFLYFNPADNITSDVISLAFSTETLFESPSTTIYYQFWVNSEAPRPVWDGRLSEILIKISLPAFGHSTAVLAHEKAERLLTEKLGEHQEVIDDEVIWLLPDKKVTLSPIPQLNEEGILGVTISLPEDKK